MAYSPYQSDAVKTLGTVYVVDDDEAVRDSIRWLLEASDYRVELYDSGESFIPYLDEMESMGLTVHFRLLLLPDHPTPIALRTHVREPIPFVIYDSEDHPQSGVPSYFDHSGDNGVFVADGDKLIDMLIRK